MVKYTKEQLKQIEEVVNKKLENLDELEIEEIEEPIFVEQIEDGEIEKANFYEAVTGMGLPYIKKGRIPFGEFEKIAPEMLMFFKRSSSPQTDTKDCLKMATKEGVEKINKRIKRSKQIREKDKIFTMERNEKINKEITALKAKKVNVNRGLMWSIYYIMRGEKRLERFEEDGKDIELLKLQNSFIDNETMDELKELRQEYYEN